MLVRRVEKRARAPWSLDWTGDAESQDADQKAVDVMTLGDATTSADATTPGELLHKARMARGLTEEAVAERLHLPQYWVRDIEADDFSKAPALIYIRGYLRAYARLVDIPPLSVLTAFEAMGWCESHDDDNQQLLRTMGQQSQRERLFRLYRKLRTGFAVIAAVAVLVLLILWWHTDKQGVPTKLGAWKVKNAMRLHAPGSKARQSRMASSKHKRVASKHRRRVAT